MKKLNLTIASIVILSACNSKPKNTNNDSTSEKKVNTEQINTQPKKTLSTTDYDMFYGAALENQIAVVKEKIQAGADVNHTDQEGRTALMFAAFNGHIDIVNLLLSSGADVSLLDNTKRCALMYACTGPFLETVKALINAGSNINATDGQENWTPLMYAASEGQLEIVKLLIDSGADISLVDVDGESSYDFALSKGHVATAEYLKQVAQNK